MVGIAHDSKSYNLGGVKVGLGNYAFKGCSGLTSVNIPKGIPYLLTVFPGCSGLTSIYIPDNIRSIGYRAFEGCTGLQSITIPNNVKEIGQEAFQ